MDFEKLYTVEDIAVMTHLTTRTIRNYLKNGLLKGRKIGGQWRFTADDVKNLMDSAAVASDLADECRQSVLDFLDGVNTDLSGDIQICCVIDLYRDQQTAKDTSDAIIGMINENKFPGAMKYDYRYDEREEKARYTVLAGPELMRAVLNVFR